MKRAIYIRPANTACLTFTVSSFLYSFIYLICLFLSNSFFLSLSSLKHVTLANASTMELCKDNNLHATESKELSLGTRILWFSLFPIFSFPLTLACVAVFSVSFQASGSRARHVVEVTKKLMAGGRGRKKKEKPAVEPRHFTERPNCFCSLETSTVTSTVTRDPIILLLSSFHRFSVASISKYILLVYFDSYCT